MESHVAVFFGAIAAAVCAAAWVLVEVRTRNQVRVRVRVQRGEPARDLHPGPDEGRSGSSADEGRSRSSADEGRARSRADVAERTVTVLPHWPRSWLQGTGELGNVSISILEGDMEHGSAVAWNDVSSHGASISCVFQGRGYSGYELVQRAQKFLPQTLFSEWFSQVEQARMGLQGPRRQQTDYLKQASRDAHRQAFSHLEADLATTQAWEMRESGLSCVAATLSGGMLTVARAGDCDCVLGMENWNGSVSAKSITVGMPALFHPENVVRPDTRTVEVDQGLRVVVLAPCGVFRVLGRDGVIEAAMGAGGVSAAHQVVRAVRTRLGTEGAVSYGLDEGMAVVVVKPWGE